MALAIPCAVAPARVVGAVCGGGGGVSGRPTEAGGTGPAVATLPVEEAANTPPSPLVTTTSQSAPPGGQVKRTPPTSRCSPAGTVTLPPGLLGSQLLNEWPAGSATAWVVFLPASPRNTKSSTASGVFVSTVRPGSRV